MQNSQTPDTFRTPVRTYNIHARIHSIFPSFTHHIKNTPFDKSITTTPSKTTRLPNLNDSIQKAQEQTSENTYNTFPCRVCIHPYIDRGMQSMNAAQSCKNCLAGPTTTLLPEAPCLPACLPVCLHMEKTLGPTLLCPGMYKRAQKTVPPVYPQRSARPLRLRKSASRTYVCSTNVRILIVTKFRPHTQQETAV